jgi:Set1/Ash2 histone methyltransferase complex subunit ASH2
MSGGSKRSNPISEETSGTSSLFPGQVLSVLFRERKLKVAEDRLTVTGDKSTGYQTILAEHSASHGEWFFEATIEDLPSDAHIRIGWSTRRTRYDQPIGSDCFSYGIRDLDCARICLGRRWEGPQKDQSLKPGDVIGCYVRLPQLPISPKGMVSDDVYTFLPNLLCDPETVPDPELLPPESSIVFTVNGQSLGLAFQNLVAGDYYPAVSLYGKAKVKFNFGPNFVYKFEHGSPRPACEMYVPKELMKPKRRPPNFIPRGLASGA